VLHKESWRPTQWDSVLPGPVREHSRKPDWQYELIETYYRNLPKLELNARRPGWISWGNELADADLECESEAAGAPPAPGLQAHHVSAEDYPDLPEFLRRGASGAPL
jgi:hypothetical protein